MNPAPKYVVISPVRDEEAFVERTIQSVLRQTVLPREWVLVDDGSTDQTLKILERYAAEYPWIHPVHRSNRGFRKAGGGVIEAFYDGYRTLSSNDWDFVVKLDGDLVLPDNYFEQCFERFQANAKLGIGGGTIFYMRDGHEQIEENPRFHVRGATKIYRHNCWDAIGGLIVAPGWDTVDEASAAFRGWTTQSFPDVKLCQQRPTGMAENKWKDLIKDGTARYIAGYHPLFLMASCMSKLLRRPYFMGSAGIFCGYWGAFLKRTPRVNDPELIQFVRREQLKRLAGIRSIWK